jgi:DNA repair exonuclease SbcCD ATPase subunit
MKIVRFTAENFKRLSLVEITPTGEVVELLGRNGQGKSSVLDAIDVAIRGLEVAPRKPIKTGAEEARIRLDLGELIVTRTFKRKDDGDMTTSLRVESADGVKKASPQTLLDSMIGALAFDPLEFERMDVRRQFDALRAFVPGVDFDEIARLNREDFERRTAVNRKAKDAKVSAERIRPAQPDENLGMIDTAALIEKLDEAGKVNADIETRKANRERVKVEIASLETSILAELGLIAECEAKIKAARERLQNYHKVQGEKQARLDAAGELPAQVDTTVIRTQISQAEASNKANAERSNAIKMREMLLAEAKQHEAAAEELTLTMDKREVQKREAIAAAKLPVDGLTFGEGELLFNGEPFSQASDAERLRVSIAMAMAMNPKLRIIRVRDGSLMDDDSMRLLAEMAKAQDFQVWVERVGSGKGVGFVLEDGHLKTGEQHHG